MKVSVGLFRIFGIPLRLHYTWFIIFAVVTLSLVYYPLAGPPHPTVQDRIVLGVIASILFFASIVTHEVAHSILAIRNNVPVKEITLFVFGGISRITREATHPRAEFSIAVVGPLTSLCMAGVFYGLHLVLSETEQQLAAGLLQWLAFINVALAAFNSVPAFPLDGGRILRAFVWRRTGDFGRATRIASRVGQVIAYALIAGGIAVMILVREGWFSGLWLILIGWFLHRAARAGYQQVLLQDALAGITARQVTDYACPLISPHISLAEVVDRYMVPTGRDCLLVTQGTRLEGMVTLTQIKKVPRASWASTSVQEIMIPASELRVARAEQDVFSVLQGMDGVTASHVPVVEGEEVIGSINRDDAFRLLRTRVDLGSSSAMGR